jgi:flagellar basal-body rod protein FlgB
MIFDRLYFQNAVAGTAMHGVVFRNDVISNNIANADTPGFKKSKVFFEDSLRNATDKYYQSGELDFSSVRITDAVVNDSFNYRLDQNNVDREVEMTELYQNAARYDVLTNMLLNNGRRLNLVLTGR